MFHGLVPFVFVYVICIEDDSDSVKRLVYG